MQVLSRYQVRREIGRGGMGVVYEAHDPRLNRTVALKVLSDGAGDPQSQARFHQEARAASALNHPNIVTIHDIESADGADCIVMEYIDGDSLSARVASGPLPVADALQIASQIASALAAAHAAAIVHRDLKPANIMVTRDGRVKLVDFGLSKLVRSDAAPDATTAAHIAPATERGIIKGTSGYMSPEQASGDPVDARTDVFSFGVVLYEMLAGKRAFTGDSYWSTLRAVVHHNPEPLARVRPEVPAGVQRLITRCLEKDPALRFSSGVELQAALSRVLDRRRRSPKATRIAATVLLILITAPAVPLYRSYVARIRAEALQEVERDLDHGRYATAFVRARELSADAPSDPQVQRALSKVTSSWQARTEPAGATVYFKEYGEPNAPWHVLGTTPLRDARPPVGALHWRVTKEGYETVEGHFWWTSQVVRLPRAGTRPDGMVYVGEGTAQESGGARTGEFWIDKYEVSNAEFKRFVDAGGYRDPRWWKHEIVRDGRSVPWKDGIGSFVDRTGRPGPATWEAGTFPPGRGDFPVSGISWYEAAAFAEFAGKSLPTIHQWQRAGGQQNVRRDIRLANFGPGPVAISSLGDLGAFGTFGLAGNVKEWVWNGVDGQRYILGGSWNEPPYMAVEADARPPIDRSETNGIRLVKNIVPPDASALADIRALPSHAPPRTPVSDEVFEAYRRFYAYERTPLDARSEGISETEDWKIEQVSIAAAYGNERVPILLLLPKNAAPPYQAVVWCPGSYSLQLDASERMAMSYYFDFVVKSGRALIMPDFAGMWSRRRERPATARAPAADAFRERVIQSAKDLSRTIDYLETRADIDSKNIAFYAFSVGGNMIAVPGMESRLKSIVWLSAGLPRRPFPPEIEPVNIAPRVRTAVLLLGGRHDYLTPIESSQKPLFDRLGTPAAAKKHVVFESGHVPERIAVIREVLGWLDRTLGPVKMR